MRRAWVYITIILCYIIGAGWQPVYNAHHKKPATPSAPRTILPGPLQSGQGYIMPSTPTARSTENPVKAGREYVQLLEDIELLAENATEQIRFHDLIWKEALYKKLLRAKEIAPIKVYKETEELYYGFLSGLELMDKQEIVRTLEKLQKLQQRIEEQD